MTKINDLTNKISGVSGTSVSGGTLASIGTDSESGKLILQANKNHTIYKVDTKWEIDVLGGNMRLVCYGPTSSPKTTTPISITPDANIGELGAKFKAIESSIAAKRNTADCSSLYTSIQNQLNGSTTSGLLTKINGKADTGHTHTQYAAVNHTHDYTTTSTCKTRYTELKNSLGNGISTLRDSITFLRGFTATLSEQNIENTATMFTWFLSVTKIGEIIKAYGKVPEKLSYIPNDEIYGNLGLSWYGVSNPSTTSEYIYYNYSENVMIGIIPILNSTFLIPSTRHVLMLPTIAHNMTGTQYNLNGCGYKYTSSTTCNKCPWYQFKSTFRGIAIKNVHEDNGKCWFEKNSGCFGSTVAPYKYFPFFATTELDSTIQYYTRYIEIPQ